MGKIVPQYLSLTELRANLLLLRRSIENEEKSGNAICAWCSNKQSSHLADGRCSVYATSQYFTSKTNETSVKVERALELTEELLQIE